MAPFLLELLYIYDLLLLRAKPTKPVPNRTNVAGSGITVCGANLPDKNNSSEPLLSISKLKSTIKHTIVR